MTMPSCASATAVRSSRRKKFRRLDHKGRFFQVEGPLNIQRSPQGQPVIFQAGSSDDGIALAGKYADAVFTHSPSLEETRAFTQKVKNSAIAHGRSGNDVKIFPGIGPIVGRTAEQAEAKYQAIAALATLEDALAYLGRFFDHHDFSQYDPDAPFPELGEIGATRSVPPPIASSRMRGRRAEPAPGGTGSRESTTELHRYAGARGR